MIGTFIQAEKVKLMANIKHEENLLFDEKNNIQNNEFLNEMNKLQSSYNKLLSNTISEEEIISKNKKYIQKFKRSDPIPIIKPPPMNLSLTFEINKFLEE